jgi:protein TonB
MPMPSPYVYPIYRYSARPAAQPPVLHPQKPAVKLTGMDPQYTEVAKRARVEGTVVIEAVIETDGRVSSARVVKGLPFGLDQAALDAVRTWLFRSAVDGGRKVRSIQYLTIPFRLPK